MLPCCKSQWASVRFLHANRQPVPDLAQGVQDLRLVQVLPHERIQRQALDPLHFQDRVPLPADPEALLQKAKIDHERQLDCRCKYWLTAA